MKTIFAFKIYSRGLKKLYAMGKVQNMQKYDVGSFAGNISGKEDFGMATSRSTKVTI